MSQCDSFKHPLIKTCAFIAAAKHGSATRVPSSVLSRGAAWLGIGGILDRHIEACRGVLIIPKDNYFPTAVTMWDAEFYIKLYDVVHMNIEGLNERIRSTVGEFLSTVGRLQAEQQKQVQEFHVLHIFYAGMCSLLLLAVGADVRAYGTQLCSQVLNLHISKIE
ncbi:hypothetical protein Tco_0723960 [Tanacetum coccineum]